MAENKANLICLETLEERNLVTLKDGCIWESVAIGVWAAYSWTIDYHHEAGEDQGWRCWVWDKIQCDTHRQDSSDNCSNYQHHIFLPIHSNIEGLETDGNVRDVFQLCR